MCTTLWFQRVYERRPSGKRVIQPGNANFSNFKVRLTEGPIPDPTADSASDAATPFFEVIQKEIVMARVCQVTGKGPMVGHNVSHANNKTKRRFLPNVQYKRFWVESEKRWVRLRVTPAAVRTITKNGIESVLADLRARNAL